MKRYLIDTHIVIWALTAPRKLGPQVREILDNRDVHVSVLSLWEMLQMAEHGKLKLPAGSVVAAITRAGASWLPLLPAHVESGLGLGALQGDPFDRMLVGTALVERMVLLTRDSAILEHALPILGEWLIAA